MKSNSKKSTPLKPKNKKIEFGFFFKNASAATKKDVFSRVMQSVNKEQREVVRRYGERKES